MYDGAAQIAYAVRREQQHRLVLFILSPHTMTTLLCYSLLCYSLFTTYDPVSLTLFHGLPIHITGEASPRPGERLAPPSLGALKKRFGFRFASDDDRVACLRRYYPP